MMLFLGNPLGFIRQSSVLLGSLSVLQNNFSLFLFYVYSLLCILVLSNKWWWWWRWCGRKQNDINFCGLQSSATSIGNYAYVQPRYVVYHMFRIYVLLHHKLRKRTQRCRAFSLLPCWWIKNKKEHPYVCVMLLCEVDRMSLKNFKTLTTFNRVYGTGRRDSKSEGKNPCSLITACLSWNNCRSLCRLVTWATIMISVCASRAACD